MASHGTLAGYSSGCHCEPCSRARLDYDRERRQGRRLERLEAELVAAGARVTWPEPPEAAEDVSGAMRRHTDETVLRLVRHAGWNRGAWSSRRSEAATSSPQALQGRPVAPVRLAIGAVALWACGHEGNVPSHAARAGWRPEREPCPECGRSGLVAQRAGTGWAPLAQ